MPFRPIADGRSAAKGGGDAARADLEIGDLTAR